MAGDSPAGGGFVARLEFVARRLGGHLAPFTHRFRARRLSRVRGSWHPLLAAFGPRVPQADALETNLESFAVRDWRRHFSSRLQGLGLEIGPLHRPLAKHDGMRVEYVDLHSAARLREIYPELRTVDLVDPDILDDAQTLGRVASERYDFVAAPHVIEHMRNPILAVENWLRVLKPGGLLYLIVPDKRATFDQARVRTTLGHLVLDYLRPSADRDYEHYLDYSLQVQKAHWWTMLKEADRLAGQDYSIHFHVFQPSDVIALLDWINRNVRRLEVVEGPAMSPDSDEFHLLVRVLPADAPPPPPPDGW